MSTAHQIDRTGKRKRTVRRTINAANAAEAVGAIAPGCEIYGLSKGQFSLIELIDHVLDATGPADITISTWTAAGADLAHASNWLRSDRIRSARWLVDYSFPNRQPAYCAQLRDLFGDNAVRTTANHAKFVLIENDRWNVVIRTSMNLNLNRRLESYEISDDPELAAWLHTVIDDAFNGGAADIEQATRTPARARATSETLAGDISRPPSMSYTLDDKKATYTTDRSRISYD